jgi:alanine dehydrogenase
MKFVTDEQVRRHVSFAAVLQAVERAFIALDSGTSSLFDVVRGHGGGEQHFFAIKSARDGSVPIIGLKAGSYAPGNHAKGLAAHTSTTLLIDDATGHPVALVEANYLNGLRTSAANALATRELARKEANTLAIIGIGGQAVFEALAVLHVRPIQRIFAVGQSPERRRAFAQQLSERSAVRVEFTDAEHAVREADIVVTVTPAQAPVLKAAWIKPGTHISAMGADNVGKQELEVELVAKSSCWVDHAPQAIQIGEMQHAYRAGSIKLEQLQQQTLGALLRGKAQRPTDLQTITIFDSSGVAIQDLAAAQAALSCVCST